MNNPNNLQALQNTAGFVISVLSPDPNLTVDFPGVGDEFGKTMMLALKTRLGKYVQFVGEKGAKFANVSEWKWALRLLDEGNNVRVMKESTVEGVKSADLFVNNVKTEIKEISGMVSDKLGDRIKETVERAIKQAGSNGNIIIDVSQQKGATKQIMEKTIERLRGKASDAYGYRIVGDNFELTGTVTPKK